MDYDQLRYAFLPAAKKYVAHVTMPEAVYANGSWNESKDVFILRVFKPEYVGYAITISLCQRRDFTFIAWIGKDKEVITEVYATSFGLGDEERVQCLEKVLRYIDTVIAV